MLKCRLPIQQFARNFARGKNIYTPVRNVVLIKKRFIPL